MPPTTTRKVLRQEIIKKLYKPRFPITSTTTATAGDTTSVDDTALAGGGHDTDYIGAWIYVAETTAGSPTIGEIARVQNVNLAASPATLDPIAPAFSDELQTGMDYEIHYKYHPSVIHDKITEVLEDLETGLLLPLTIITDGDMEDNPTINFTGNNATRTNDSVTVLHGRQSLKVVATGTPGTARSSATAVPSGTTFLCATDCFLATDTSARLILVDSTGASPSFTELETAKTDETGWVHLEFTHTTANDIDSVQLWLEASTSGDTVYFDNAILLPVNQSFFTPPNEAEYTYDFGDLFFYPLGDTIGGANDENSYRLFEGSLRSWGAYEIERSDTATVPFRIMIEKNPITHPLWIEVDIDFTSLASDSATTKAPKVLVRELALALLWDDMADEEDEAGNLQEGLVLRKRADRTRLKIRTTWSEFRPLRSKIWGAKR